MVAIPGGGSLAVVFEIKDLFFAVLAGGQLQHDSFGLRQRLTAACVGRWLLGS